MNAPLVSILVPIYRVEQYIERCARSLFEQSYENLEFVFVDDCSPDNSVQMLDRIIKDYPLRAERVHIIRHEKNRCALEARKTALKYSNGIFLSHVDSDDWLEPNAIEMLMKKQQATGADIVSGRQMIHFRGGKTKERGSGQGMGKDELLQNLCTHRCTSVLWGRIIRATLYTEQPIISDARGSYGEDFQVLPQLIYYSTSIESIDDVVYHYNRVNENALTSSLNVSPQIQLEYLFAHQIVSKFFEGKNPNCQCLCDETAKKYYHLFMRYQAQNRCENGYDIIKQSFVNNKRLSHGKVGWLYQNYRHVVCVLVLQESLQYVKGVIRRIIR